MAQQFTNACLLGVKKGSARQGERPRQVAGITPACSRVINVNVHFILRADGSGNWNETDNGLTYHRFNDPNPNDPSTAILPDTAQNGYAYAKSLIDTMNYVFAHNPVQSIHQVLLTQSPRLG